MDSERIREFAERFPEVEFPVVRSLLRDEIRILECKLRKLCEFYPWRSITDAISALTKDRGRLVCKANLFDDSKSLIDQLLSNGIDWLPDKIYFESSAYAVPDFIDEIALVDLSRYFSIFVGQIDDVEIFDSTLNWFLLITHDEEIFLYDRRSGCNHDCSAIINKS